MRTKRKNYDYRSSDSANDDYEQDEYQGDEVEDDEPIGDSDGDSAYGESNDEKKVRSSSVPAKIRKRKNSNDYAEDEEESYEDEDPFSPEIDQILADKQVDLNALELPTQSEGQQRHTRQVQILQQPQKQNWYLIKFTDQSYLHVKWMEEKEMEEYSYRARQKIRRYWIAKEKKRAYQEFTQRQAIAIKPKIHHFSDDEEEEDDDEAGIKNIPLPDIPAILEDIQEVEKRKTLEVLGANGEDLSQHFDKNFIAVERILSTTNIFPVVHPRQARQVRGKWQQDCLLAINVLVNYRKNNVCIGLTFSEQLDIENEDLANYFKVVKQPIDFTMITNRLYNKFYSQPTDFWNDLGLVFKNCRSYYKSTKLGLRKQCDALRVLAYHLYLDWYQEQLTRFQTGIALPYQSQVKVEANANDFLAPQNNNQSSQNLQDFKNSFSQDANQFQQQQSNKFNQLQNIPDLPEKDPTIVNLSSLFDKSQNNQQQQNIQTNQFQNQQWNQSCYQQPNQSNQNMLQSIQQQNQFSKSADQPDFWNAISYQQQTPNLPQSQELFNNFQSNSAIPPNLPKFGIMFNQQEQEGGISGYFEQQKYGQTFSGIGAYVQDNQNEISQNYGRVGNEQSAMNMMLANPITNQLNNQAAFGAQSFERQQQYQPSQATTNDQLSIQGYMGGASNDINQNFYNQMMINNPQGTAVSHSTYQPDNLILMGQGGVTQDQNQLQNSTYGFLPSLQSMANMNNQLGLQLPSLNQMGALMGEIGGGNSNQQDPNSYQQQSNLFGNLFHNQSSNPSIRGAPSNQIQQQNPQNSNAVSVGGYNVMDEYSQYMFGAASTKQTLPKMNSNFIPFGYNEQKLNPQQQQNQILDYSQPLMNNYSVLNQGQPYNNDISSYNQLSLPQMNHLNQYGGPQQNQQQQIISQQQQITSDINYNNLIQAEDNYNEKQEPPVTPAIIDPGQFDLNWLLDRGDQQDELKLYIYLSKQEILQAVKQKQNVDILYLVKWKSLSYTQSSWEGQNRFSDIYGDKIQDYLRFNRSLDQFQRDRMDQLIKNHKKMKRITEKKYQTSRKPDPIQEDFLQLQEQKYNRQLLNYKIQELLGNQFNQIIQYTEAKGFVPQFKKPIYQLKDYQINGLNWLIRAWHDHRNVVLADEMGLGKTIMTLAFFDHLFKMQKLRGPFLILAPLTTLEHWKRIADEWTSMNSVLYYDQNSAEGRQDIRLWEWFYTDVTYKGTITQKSELYKFNIMITSFEVFMQDLNPILQEIPFVYIVVDEAHRLKNKQAKTLRLLKDHPCKRILLLTGTPVQNNTKELWTLLNYIEPEKFSSMDQFLEEYGNLETYEQITKLHTLIKPHFLRRLKEEVDNSIPPLQETVIEVGLTSLQNTYYKGIYGENRMMLAKFGTNSIKTTQLNNIDIQLRKCCNHLFLLKGVEEELTKMCKNEQDIYKKLLESSGKLMLLDKFIEKFKQENHKMLIFSQFKKMLDIIELYLRMKGLSYEMLTGSVKTQDRISAIQRFNDDKSFGVFLLTTRAGGLGINLTSARVVIIFDSDWNPQNDLQAIARAHRIGQKFEVQVYRLITTKTYEEQMFERASKKLGMEQALFSKGAFNQENDVELTGLALRGLAELKQDSKDIENLLKYGAYAFIDNDDGDDMMNQQNKDIDEILATGKKKEFSYNKGVYTLQKSTFNALKYEKLPDVNDPDFWNKALPFESIISINVLEKKFKKEKKELNHSEKLQKEYIKDIEIVFNDFMEAKFDNKTTASAKKQLEADEEKLREMLKKMIKLTGLKLIYIEKCKEWLREMLRTNKRKKTPANNIKQQQITDNDNSLIEGGGLNDEDDDVEEDDIIIDDSDEQFEHPINGRNLRKRTQKEPTAVSSAPVNYQSKQIDPNAPIVEKGKRGRKPANWNGGVGKVQSSVGTSNDQQNRMKLKKRGRLSDEDVSDYGDDAYWDEDDMRRPQQQNDKDKRKINKEDDNDSDNSEAEGPDARYGLRARKKRQKTNKDDYFTAHQRMNMPKINEQFAKRNEKNGIVCSYCLRPEPPYCYWFCHGYCQRFFHSECKEMIFSNMNNMRSEAQKNYKLANNNEKASWICDDCLDNKAQCFCCKQKGQILLFPKKGRPKAAGSYDESQINLNIDEMEGEYIQEEEDDEEPDEDFEDDELEQNQLIYQEQQQKEVKEEEKQIGDIVDNKFDKETPLSDSKNQNEQIIFHDDDQQNIELLKQAQSPSKITINTNLIKKSSSKLDEDFNEEESQSNDSEGINQDIAPLAALGQEQQQQQIIFPSSSTKIVLNTSSFKPLEPENKPIKATTIQEEQNNDKQYVVRCTLGGCFKYYHVSCVYKNKNVSCINSMKVQRFRCPLHYCDICQVSGDSVLIVQCVTCPTAYHLKCFPQDTNAIRLTKKYIICGKHNMSPEDFPRYEEKTTAQYGNSNNNIANFGSKPSQMLKGSNKEKKYEKKQKKRKGKQQQKQQKKYYNEEEEEYESDQEQYSSPIGRSYGGDGKGLQPAAHSKDAGQSTGFMISLQPPEGKNYGSHQQNSYQQQSNSRGIQGGGSSSSIKEGTPKPLFSVVKSQKQ